MDAFIDAVRRRSPTGDRCVHVRYQVCSSRRCGPWLTLTMTWPSD